MPSFSRFLRGLIRGDGARRQSSHRPDFRVRLSLNSLEVLEDRTTPSASPFASAVTASSATDINAWSSELAALPPTQSFGDINVATTINGTGGQNVIDVNGNITAGLVLNGTASDVFIVNVHGDLKLRGSESLGLAGGTTAAHVVYNFIGAKGKVSAQTGDINGTLLSPTYDVQLSGTTLNGELLTAGTKTKLDGGVVVNPDPFVPPDTSVAHASISGTAHEINGNPYGGMVVTLTYIDAQGNPAFLTTETDVNGHYSFTDLAAGTYTLIFDGTPFGGTAVVGTVDVGAGGTLMDDLTIEGISLGTGDSIAANYDFLIPNIS